MAMILHLHYNSITPSRRKFKEDEENVTWFLKGKNFQRKKVDI